jgi:metal-responsive CopG/Arc/MetJ family transcriptional regulator
LIGELAKEMLVVKVKIESALYDRAKVAAEAAGYSSVEEFIADCVEKAIQRLKIEEEEGPVSDQLRGLGYIE